MRVEVRKRSESSRHVGGAGPSNPTLTEAYSDRCFQAQTRFYIVAPEHPKLGKWTQPSTLKYSQHSTTTTTMSLDETARPASSGRVRNPRPTCSSSRVAHGGRVRPSSSTSSAAPTVASNNRSACRPSRVRQRVNESRGRSTRPVSLLLCARSESPPSSAARGRQEVAPRIDTPISGRVAPLHQRSFHASPLPSSPYLCGSFDQQQQQQQTAAAAGGIVPLRTTTAPTHFSRLADDEDDSKQALYSLSPAAETACPNTSDGDGAGLRAGTRRGREEAVESQVEPNVRYRVRLENIARRVDGNKQEAEGGQGGTTPQNIRDEDSSSSDYYHHTRPPPRGGLFPGQAPMSPKSQGCAPTPAVPAPDSGVTDPWVTSEVDPFLEALRHALLHHRPADIASFVSSFPEDYRRGSR